MAASHDYVTVPVIEPGAPAEMAVGAVHALLRISSTITLLVHRAVGRLRAAAARPDDDIVAVLCLSHVPTFPVVERIGGLCIGDRPIVCSQTLARSSMGVFRAVSDKVSAGAR